MQNSDSGADRWLRAGPARSELAVPLAALASLDDIEHAEGLLAMHQPRAIVRRICSGCGEPWPCVDTLYGWAVTGTVPDGGLPGPAVK
jgi:hypothetical protein